MRLACRLCGRELHRLSDAAAWAMRVQQRRLDAALRARSAEARPGAKVGVKPLVVRVGWPRVKTCLRCGRPRAARHAGDRLHVHCRAIEGTLDHSTPGTVVMMDDPAA
jgi:hypothetical protein